jgi:cellulose synthase/poly-beta-1,6-N-acetylglucosamine synthase-like glycosyltransferase
MHALMFFQLLALVCLGLLLAVWVLYPAAMRALARGRGASVPAPDERLPSVSVVIATREAPEAVRARVADILAADYPAERLQVVVSIDDSAELGAAEMGTLDARVRVVRGDAPGGKAAALNAGARAARGEVLVMGDTHSRFEPDAIARLAGAAMSPRVGAVSGRLVLPGAEGAGKLVHAYWSMESRLREDEAVVHSTAGVTGAIYAMRRALWSPLPAGLILDDVWVPMRLVLEGYRVGYARAAVAVDVREPVRESEFRRKVRTLTGVLQLCAWMPALLVPGRNPIWAQFLLHKLLRLLTPYLLLGAGVGLIGVAVVSLGARQLLLALGLAAAVVALLLMARAELRHRVREALLWGLTLQAAVVVATINGLRGRWNVWHR